MFDIQLWIKFFSNPIVWGIITLAVGWKFHQYSTQIKDPDSERFQKLRDRIEGVSSRDALYNAGLDKFLTWTDKFFSPGLNSDPNLNKNKAASPNVKVLSAPAYDRCLQMALVYPLAVAILGWLIFGTAGDLGRAIGITDLSAIGPRILTCVYMIVVGGLWYKFLKTDSWQSMIWLVAGFTVIVLGRNYLIGFGVPETVLAVVSIAYASALVLVLAFIFAFTLGFASTAAGTVVLTAIIVYVTKIDSFFADAFVLIVVIATMLFFEKKPQLLWLIILVSSSTGLAAVYLLPILIPAMVENKSAVALLIGLVLLPLINVPFDFLSIALTRTLLRKSRDQKPGEKQLLSRLGFAVFDLVCAFGFLIILAIVMVISLQVFDNLAGKDVINVAAVISGIEEHPASSENLWVYFALFSTLLPTLIHAVIGVSSLISFRITKPQKALAWLDEDNDTARLHLTTVLTLQFYASVVLVLLAAMGLLWVFVHLLGLSDALLSLLSHLQVWTAGFAK